MRYTLKIIFFFFILTYLVSCGNTSKKNDEPTQKSQHEDARKLKYSDGIAGEVIAQNAAKKLGAKLNLTTEQTGRLSDLLQQTLTGSGYDLEKSYSLEE